MIHKLLKNKMENIFIDFNNRGPYEVTEFIQNFRSLENVKFQFNINWTGPGDVFNEYHNQKIKRLYIVGNKDQVMQPS